MSSDTVSMSSQNHVPNEPLFNPEKFAELYPLYKPELYSEPVLNSTLTEAIFSLQTYDLFRKYVPSDSTQDTCDAAIDTFLECEDTCWLTNCRVLSQADYQLNYLLSSARKIVKVILGSFSYDDLLHSVRHSGGATVTRSRKQGHPVYKILDYEVSSSCCTLLRRVIHDLHESSEFGWSLSDLASYSVHDANKIATVPKSSSTDRPIGMEPSGNMFIQLGLGGMIRRRLRKFGIDLNDQSCNREFARVGSITGKYATIDLSSASDTISYELVKELIPADWFTYLDHARSDKSTIAVSKHKGTTLTLQKFSSMGNGFTFELESLIFYAITLASINLKPGSDNISVFGDDIIVPSYYYNRVANALECCGFSVNHSKSFRLGPFKESCGGNYFKGFDITPIRIKKDITDDLEIYWLYNSVVKQAYHLDGFIPKEDFHGCLKYLESCLSNRQHYSIPCGIGDGGLRELDGFASIAKPVTKFCSSLHRMFVRSRVRVAKASTAGGLRGLLLYALSSPQSLPADIYLGKLPPREHEPVTVTSGDYKIKNKWIML